MVKISLKGIIGVIGFGELTVAQELARTTLVCS